MTGRNSLQMIFDKFLADPALNMTAEGNPFKSDDTYKFQANM